MKNVNNFLGEVRIELSKIIWPKFDELIGSMIIVLLIVTAFSIYLGIIDFIFYKLAQQIF
jgi:preprotein translocase SecE subunit